jgi:ATP-dependent Zn protease
VLHATEGSENEEKGELLDQLKKNEKDMKNMIYTAMGHENPDNAHDEDDDEGEDVHVPNATPELINFFAERMSALTPGFAGAEIANICNEAAIIAARTDSLSVGLAAFEKAADRVIGGIEKPNKIMTPLEKRTVAYHEAGHAIVGWFSENASPLLKVTIVPRTSGALGFAQYLPKELNLHTKEQIMDMMCMTLGGRAAEELTFGNVTTGASDDLNKVTQMAYSMVKIYGMCDRIGNVSFPPNEGQMEFDKPYSDSLAQIMDEEARKLVDEAYERTKQLLIEHSDDLIGVAEKLLERETINQDDVIAIVGERPFDNADNYQGKHGGGGRCHY